MNPEIRKKIILWSCIGVFALVNCLCIWKKEFFLFPAVSFVLLVIYLMVFRVDWLMYFMAFVTPLSIVINDERVQLGISLPSEFIMIALRWCFFVVFCMT